MEVACRDADGWYNSMPFRDRGWRRIDNLFRSFAQPVARAEFCLIPSTVFRLEWLIPVAHGTQQVRQIDDVLGDNMDYPALLLEASTTPDHS